MIERLKAFTGEQSDEDKKVCIVEIAENGFQIIFPFVIVVGCH